MLRPRSFGLLASLAALLPAVPAGAVQWNDILRQPAEWYASAEARRIADTVLLYQTPEGGWPKNRDMLVPPDEAFLASTKPDQRAPTLDNDATTTQIEFLARVATAQDVPAGGMAVLRGLDYLLDAQYANGGWPQYYPLVQGYYTHITFNDDAMVNVLGVLRAVAQGRKPYAFVDEARRARAAAAGEKGLACILRCQVRQGGQLTAWCAQHDEITLAPAWARNFEPPSLSGSESVGIVKFLLGIEKPSPEIIAAIEGAVTWLQAVTVSGLRVDEFTGHDGKPDRRAVPDPAAPPLWARFYELGTNRPVFTGRDKVIRYDFNAIERERRTGYGYLGTWPAGLLAKDYPRWRAQHHSP